MKTEEVIKKIVKKGDLKDDSIGQVTQWIMENEGKETVSKYIAAINKDEILTLTPKGKAKGRVIFRRLRHSPFFNGLAVRYSQNGWFEEAEIIFKEILKKTRNDVDANLNYGATISDKILNLYNQGKGIDKKLLEKGRALIFKAFRYDLKVHDDWRNKPAYKDLCYVRAIEAMYYYHKNELFTAFVLGWMSIEMSLYRIWFQFIPKETKARIDELMSWNTEYIIETLFLSNAHKSFKNIKKDLDTLKGTRNHLLHGKIEKPTTGEVKLCINTATKLHSILQG